MKRLFIFICFLLFVSFIAANTQIQRPQKRNEQDRILPSGRSDQFLPREISSIDQPSPSEWARVYYEESEYMLVYSVLENNTNDGYFVTGRSPGSGADYHQWIYKLSPEGDVEWKYMDLYPDGPLTEIHSIQPTTDGGYVAIGRYRPEYSSTGPGFGVIKFSPQFDVEWARNYDGPFYENPWSIQQTSDGGYILAGATFSFIDPLPPEIAYDVWVLKLSSTGDVEWQKVYGGPGHEIQRLSKSMVTILETSDGGYIFACDTNSFGAGWTDLWLVKLTSTGDIKWQKTYGGTQSEWFSLGGPHIQLTNDGGYIIAGSTLSFGVGYTDVWILRISSTGDIEWQKTYGGASGADFAHAIQPTNDGGYVITGSTASFGVGGSPDSWTPAFWLLKISADGDIELQKTYGADRFEEATCVQQTSDGGYIMAGTTNSFTPAHTDTLVIKVSPTGELGPGDGLIKARNSDAVVQNTYVSPSDTTVIPRVTDGSASLADPVFAERELLSEVVAWPFHQPPVITDFKSESDRGLTKGIRADEVTGETHPWNIQHNFNDDIERIIAYWKYVDEGYTSYRRLSDVIQPTDTFEFQNEILDPLEFNKARHYAFATETSQGVSPKSPPVGGALDTTAASDSVRETTGSSKTLSSSKKVIHKENDTNASSQDKKIIPGLVVFSKNQSSLVLPPKNLCLEITGNLHILTWEPLHEKQINKIRIYRKKAEASDESYELVKEIQGYIPGCALYVPNPDEKVVYVVTAVYTDNKESAKSNPVRN